MIVINSFVDEVLPEKRTKEVAVIQGDNPSNKKGKKDKKARKHKEATVQNNQQLEGKFNCNNKHLN